MIWDNDVRGRRFKEWIPIWVHTLSLSYIWMCTIHKQIRYCKNGMKCLEIWNQILFMYKISMTCIYYYFINFLILYSLYKKYLPCCEILDCYSLVRIFKWKKVCSLLMTKCCYISALILFFIFLYNSGQTRINKDTLCCCTWSRNW